MKKIKNIFLALFIFSLIFGVFVINAFAYENNQYENVAHHYFENLGNSIPDNCHASCAYVAMGMLLSFYDIYWSDSFITDNDYLNTNGAKNVVSRAFPNGTPGLLLENDDLSESEKENVLEYKTFVQNKAEDYFHMYLLSLGMNMGISDITDETCTYEITFYDQAMILDKYFDSIFGENDYYGADENCSANLPLTIHYMYEIDPGQNRESILNKIREEVDKGNPVIYRGDRLKSTSTSNISGNSDNNSEKVGHVMIAYHAESDGDILLHTGHIKENESEITTTVEKTEYNLNIGVFWIEINTDILEHVCSNYYTYNNLETAIDVCSCVAYKYVHPAHSHINLKLEQYDSNQHKYKCSWGCEIKKDHDTVHQIDGDYHSFVCECGYSYEEPFSISYQQSNDSHVVTYECGSNYDKSHSFMHSSLSDTYHNKICKCGYSYKEDHDFEYNTKPVLRFQHSKSCKKCTYSTMEAHALECHQTSDEKHAFICECGYSYEEEHSLSWWQRSVANHTFICECGYSYTEPHNFIEQDYHTSVCADCGETVTTPHESEVYEQLSATQHLVVCGCGYEGEAPHIFTCVSISASMHRMTCVCGYTTLDIHNFSSSVINPRYQTCTECGYTRDKFGPGGGNVIMGKEEDEETTE